MSRTLIGAILAGFLLLCLLVQAPARLLTAFIPAGQLEIQGFSGTVWRGSASRALLATGRGYFHLGNVQWTLNPLSLLLFAPAIELTSTWPNQSLSGRVVFHSASKLSLHDFELRLPAHLIRRFAPLELAGTLSAQVHSLSLEGGVPTEAQGRLVWQHAVWDSPQGQILLGDYAFEFAQQGGEAFVGQVLTLSGPVNASGTVSLVGRRYSIDVLVTGDGVLDAQLEQALSLLAAPSPEGYRIQFNGDI